MERTEIRDHDTAFPMVINLERVAELSPRRVPQIYRDIDRVHIGVHRLLRHVPCDGNVIRKPQIIDGSHQIIARHKLANTDEP